MPILLALANPRFSRLRISLNSGNNSATSSGVPSVEALSTTITSQHTGAQCCRNDSRHSSTYFLAFHTTMTTEARAGAACGCGESWGAVWERQVIFYLVSEVGLVFYPTCRYKARPTNERMRGCI